MNIEITKISVSKKGTVWIQAKALDAGEELKEGDKFECHKVEVEEKKEEK